MTPGRDETEELWCRDLPRYQRPNVILGVDRGMRESLRRWWRYRSLAASKDERKGVNSLGCVSVNHIDCTKTFSVTS